MRTLLDEQSFHALWSRIAALEPSDIPRWGEMTASQMVCHLTDQIRMAFGEIALADRSNVFHRLIGKRLALLGIMPRGIQTAEELDYSRGGGTQPTDFESDKETLRSKLRQFRQAEEKALSPHMLLGPLTREEWGAMIYLHIVHHLRQFGR